MLLTACGSDSVVRATVPRPDSAPRAATSQPTPLPTNSDDLIFDNIPLQIYNHPSQAFSIRHPANWQLFERPDGVIFIDPTAQAAYGIIFSPTDPDTDLTPAALNDFASQFVQTNFGGEAAFELLDEETSAENALRFRSLDPNLGPAITEVSVSRQGNTVYLTQLTIVEDKWTANVAGAQTLLRTLLKTEAQPTPTPTPRTGPPNWTIYTHPSEKFAFLYPDTWVITDTTRSVSAFWPEGSYTFTVRVLTNTQPITLSKQPLTETLASGEDLPFSLSYVISQTDSLSNTQPNFQARPIEVYDAGVADGFTVDYVYGADDEIGWAGSIIAFPIQERLFALELLAPADAYNSALAWFNLMMQSFQLLPADDPSLIATPAPP
jgi:hypothetical protein